MEERRVLIGVVEEETTLAPLPAGGHPNFAMLWAGAYAGTEEQMQRAWEKLRDAWLKAKFRKSDSPETRRSYETATSQWLDYLTTLRHPNGQPVHAWEVTTQHVALWQEVLEQSGQAATTVNQRLAACSSYYSFVMNEKALINGIEISAFMDATGKTRSNPFKGGNVQRAKVKPYGKARKLTTEETRQLFSYLESKKTTITGARNYALLNTYLLTGYRNAEVVSRQWGDIEPNPSQPGSFIIKWKGKGAKEEREEFPARAYHAIVHYLKIVGRWPDIRPDEYIFRPLITHGESNLRNQRSADANENRAMSSKAALRTLRTVLKRAGIADPDSIRVHDLRHTYAKMFLKQTKDLQKLRGRLHHSSLATTDIYTREVLTDPVDDWSESVYQGMLMLD
jgi:site-specific recombinase XerD